MGAPYSCFETMTNKKCDSIAVGIAIRGLGAEEVCRVIELSRVFSYDDRQPGELDGLTVLNTLLLMAPFAPLVFLAVTLIVQGWEENRLRFPRRRRKPDNDNEGLDEELFDD